MKGQAPTLLSRTSWPGGGTQTGKYEFTPVLQHVTAVRLSPFQPAGIPQAHLSVHSSCVHTHTHTLKMLEFTCTYKPFPFGVSCIPKDPILRGTDLAPWHVGAQAETYT